DSRELEALITLYGDAATPRAWPDRLADLSLGEAVLLPDRTAGDLAPRAFRLLPRLSPHIRHRHKYLDVPIPEQYAFVFNGGTPRRIRTLHQLCHTLSHCSDEELDGHLERGDFSRWIVDVFGDYPLAARLRDIEERHRRGDLVDARDRVLESVKQRYVLADEPDLTVANGSAPSHDG
ncbi:MAG TPA: hypothetical protein VHL51_07725, partial [Gaiellales bacterium]|nr:hypothetical protein [Gaiellales bacterium]